MKRIKRTRESYVPADYTKVETPENLAIEIFKNEFRQTAMYFSGRRSKPDAHYHYRSVEKLNEAIQDTIKSTQETFDRNKRIKAELDKKATELAESITEGDIFCYSWGWEQTNVNFYQVIEKKTPKTMIVREIGCEILEETSWASDVVRPVKDSFLKYKDGDFVEEKVRINKWGGFNRSCGSASKVENPSESRYHRSWYA